MEKHQGDPEKDQRKPRVEGDGVKREGILL